MANRMIIQGRVRKAAEEALHLKQFVSPIDILLGIGFLLPEHLEDWRRRRVSYLEKIMRANLNQITFAMKCFRSWATQKGLKPSKAAYLSRSREPKIDLQFSKSGDPQIELSYRTHYVSPKLSEQKQGIERLKKRLGMPCFNPIVSDSQELVVATPTDAQEYCNFIVFTPVPPADLVLKKQQLRPETAGTHSSYRQVFEGPIRTLVIKQFLYDKAPPAYDYPSLWRNAAISTTNESPPPRGILLGDHVLWMGTNYRKQSAATIELEGTRIEITLERGIFSDDELVELCQKMQPTDQKARSAILNTPLAHLSYCARHAGGEISIPIGYWKHQRRKSLRCRAVVKLEQVSVHSPYLRNKLIPVLQQFGYLLNSIFVFEDEENRPAELEYVFEHYDTRRGLIRVLTSSLEDLILFPPELGDQECTSTILSPKKFPFHYAYSKSFALGPHEFVFKVKDETFIVLVTPTSWTSQKWILRLITDLSPSAKMCR